MKQRIWLDNFLFKRHLNKPDGRALYAYRIEGKEFEELTDILCHSEIINDTNQHLFVCYASEWWRRKYEGGRWKWQNVFESINCPEPSPSDKERIASFGLKFWDRKVSLHACGRSAYLMTLVTEGGFPIRLINHPDSHLSYYLHAILNDYSRYASSGMDALRVSESHSNRLPPSFRKPAVYQLASEFIKAILALSKKIGNNSQDPFKDLEDKDSSWRDTLPLSMGDENAEILVNGLLSQAKKNKELKYNKIKINRFFVNVDGVLKHKALVELPSTIPISLLPENPNSLSRSLKLVIYFNGRINEVASLRRREETEQYYVYPASPDNLKLSLGVTTSVEFRVVEYSGDNLGSIPISGGEGLVGDMPISCYKDNGDYLVIGQGRIRTRFDRIYTSIPIGCSVESGQNFCESLPFNSDTDTGEWVEVSGNITIRLKDGSKCSLTVGEEQDRNLDYTIYGKRQYLYEADESIIYSGMPTLFQFDDVQKKAVANNTIFWKPNSQTGEWHLVSNEELPPQGNIKIKIIEDEEKLYSTSFIVLPDTLKIEINPGEKLSGNILLMYEGEIEVNIGIDSIDLNISKIDGGIKIDCKTEVIFPGKIPIELLWSDFSRCKIMLPFPVQNSIFTYIDGRQVTTQQISLNELSSISVMAISHKDRSNFKIEGALRSQDIDHSLSRALHFIRDVPKIAEGHFESRLSDIWQLVRDLFGYSADIDAVVTLELTLNGAFKSKLEVTQFHSQLHYDHNTHQITCLTSNPKPCLIETDIRLISMFAGDMPEIDNKIISLEGDTGWQLSNITELTTPSLAIVTGPESQLVRPCVIFNTDDNMENKENELHRILSISDEQDRRKELKILMMQLSEDACNDCWDILIKSIRVCSEVHPDSLDLYKAIINNPVVAAGLLIRTVEDDLKLLLKWEDFLPFKWWQLPIPSIVKAMKDFKDYAKSKHPNYINDLMSNANTQMERMSNRSPIFQVISKESKKGICEQVDNELEMNKLNSSFFSKIGVNDWPNGLDRRDWECVFGTSLPWFDDGKMKYRRPLLDAIMAQAYSITHNQYLGTNHRAFICVMYRFSPSAFEEGLNHCITLFQIQVCR